MSGKVLQINFKFNVSASDYEAAVAPLASEIAKVPGLLWKVWLMNEADSEAGGIYLFSDAQSVQDYLGSPIVAGIKSHPALTNITAKVFDTLSEPTRTTRGPLATLIKA